MITKEVVFILVAIIFFSCGSKQENKEDSKQVNLKENIDLNLSKNKIDSIKIRLENYLGSEYKMFESSVYDKISDSSYLYDIHYGVGGAIHFLSIDEENNLNDTKITENYDTDGFDIDYTYTEVEIVSQRQILIKEYGLTPESSEMNEEFYVKKVDTINIIRNNIPARVVGSVPN